MALSISGGSGGDNPAYSQLDSEERMKGIEGAGKGLQKKVGICKDRSEAGFD
jgi:hypothetical protein